MKQKQHPLKLMTKPVKQELHLKKRKIADELVCITHMITAIVITMYYLKKLQIRIVSDRQRKQIRSKYLWMAVISQQINLGIQTTQGVDIEFVPDNEKELLYTRPRVVIEKPKGEKLRCLIWNNKSSEDYSDKITFE